MTKLSGDSCLVSFSYFSTSMREEQMVRICLCIHVCGALPMIVGAWSMAVYNAMVAL